MSLPWLDIIGGVAKIADDLITTDEERQKLIIQERMIDAQLMQGQVEINKIEAASPDRYVAGWRPFIGWVGGVALGMVYIPKALVLTGVWTYQAVVIVSQWSGTAPPPMLPAYPDLGVTDLLGLLGSLLGFGVMRSYDKTKGVDTKAIASHEDESPA